ncbi:farnesyl diphosphate synthase-like [Papilio machaon]|uniref:farnesyl diphosphate synthase-like n=1 Tax=Papilio machaon TaxID=76193 RepID=UPI001E6645C7|nr:farnesyl diphosphate synthase-like [Papilio machaon]
MTMMAYEVLENPIDRNEKNLYKAQVVSCAMELMNLFIAIGQHLDTMIPKAKDYSLFTQENYDKIVRYKCTFYCLEMPIMLALILSQKDDEATFKRVSYIVRDVGTLFQMMAFIHVAIGQHLDAILSRSKDYSLFTQENYDNVVKYKCTYYTMKLPLMLAMILADRADDASYELAENLCRDVGALFQMKNDFMDCFDLESESGKSGTDIQEGKCTWLAVKSLERGNPQQRKTFTTCYGSWNPEDVETIKSLYKDLDLKSLYEEQQIIRYKMFMQKVQELPSNATPTPQLFLKLLQMAQDGQ